MSTCQGKVELFLPDIESESLTCNDESWDSWATSVKLLSIAMAAFKWKSRKFYYIYVVLNSDRNLCKIPTWILIDAFIHFSAHIYKSSNSSRVNWVAFKQGFFLIFNQNYNKRYNTDIFKK